MRWNFTSKKVGGWTTNCYRRTSRVLRGRSLRWKSSSSFCWLHRMSRGNFISFRVWARPNKWPKLAFIKPNLRLHVRVLNCFKWSYHPFPTDFFFCSEQGNRFFVFQSFSSDSAPLFELSESIILHLKNFSIYRKVDNIFQITSKDMFSFYF